MVFTFPRKSVTNRITPMNVRMMVLLVGVLLLVTNFGIAGEITGKVVGVHDGDTITLLAPGNIEIKVRLEGIDAPELKQDFGNASKLELSRTVFGKQVRMEDRGKRPLWPHVGQYLHRAGMGERVDGEGRHGLGLPQIQQRPEIAGS